MPAPAPAPAPHAPAECVIVDDTARPRITIAATPAGTDPYDRASDVIGRIAGAQQHETLVRITCDGRLAPALADSWSTSDSIHWRFRIAQRRQFADGTSVDARSIVAAWSTTRTPLLAEVAAAGTNTVDVTLHEPAGAELFALPALSVIRTADGSATVGTGPYRAAGSAADRTLRLIARTHEDDRTRQPDTLVFRTFGGDMRMAIDAGIDVLIARDAATLAYAHARSDYAVAPLPWNRTWILASAPAHPPSYDPITAGTPDTTSAAEFPEGLLGVPVRAPVPPQWWNGCSMPAPAATGRRDTRVLYDQGDPTARTIAERVAALTRGRTPAWLRERVGSNAATAAGVSEPELVAALHAHTALAVVMSMPSRRFNSCAAMSPVPLTALLRGWRISALVQTRDALVYRPGIGHVTVDAEGTPRFGGHTPAAGAR